MKRSLLALLVGSLSLLGIGAVSIAHTIQQTNTKITAPDTKPLVVATTPLIADLARQVGGKNAQVRSIVPSGADPHTYEPRLSTLRDITRADLVLANGLLLEDQAVRDMVDGNLKPGANLVELGENSLAYGAYHIPLIEDTSLDTVWLGLRVDGQISDSGKIEFRVTEVTGPGTVSAFTTGIFGQPSVWLDSSDGLTSRTENTGQYRAHHGTFSTKNSDTLALPKGSHTHMSWGFSAPGHYRVKIRAFEINSEHAAETALGEGILHFAVGVEPGANALSHGHVDLFASQETSSLTLRGEYQGRSYEKNSNQVTIAVPHSARTVIPAESQWRFLGKAGEPTWVLAQAVVGKHVHGEIDPHLWLDVHNAWCYVESIAQALMEADPSHQSVYRENAQKYQRRLDQLDSWIATVLATIPSEQKRLVTAHDAYGYLAHRYNLQVVGFAAANSSLEPSAGQLATLTDTLRDMRIPAVFVESSTRSGTGELQSIAKSLGIKVCQLSADTLTAQATSYLQVMVQNTKTLKSCLDPASLPAWDFKESVPSLKLWQWSRY